MFIKKVLVSCISSAVLCGSLATSSVASVPVIDIPRVVTDVAEFIAEYIRWKDQLEGWKKNIEVTTGNKNIGSLMNSGYYKSVRRYLPDDLVTSIDQISQGNYSGTNLSAELNKIDDELVHFQASLVFDDLSSIEAKTYIRRKSQTMLGMAIAEKSFNKNEQRLQEIESLLDSIDNNGSDDAKASTDLNSRMTGQTAILQTEQLKVQAYMLKALTEQNNRLNEEDAVSRQMLSNKQVLDLY
jgi:hypothetical protein